MIVKHFPYLLLSYVVFSCSPPSTNNTVDPEQFHNEWKSSSEPILVDVRTPEEFNEGHLIGAVNYNIYDTSFITHISALKKSKEVFVYCKKGGRSSDAAEMFDSLGFKHIYNLSGGYEAWTGQGFPIEK